VLTSSTGWLWFLKIMMSKPSSFWAACIQWVWMTLGATWWWVVPEYTKLNLKTFEVLAWSFTPSLFHWVRWHQTYHLDLLDYP
jgi:hypothetical protein